MAKPLLDGKLWATIEPWLPQPKVRRERFPGRKPISNRQALTGILFVLKTGIPWEYLPQELGCGSGMTCWRRLRDWQTAGVWQRIHEHLLATLRHADQIDWSRAVVDSASIRALRGGKKQVQTPQIERNRAANITSLRMRKAFPWPPGSPVRTRTMSPS